MQNGLRRTEKWAIDAGLDINPKKTELVLFTMKYKVSKCLAPTLSGTGLSVAESVKYVGLILCISGALRTTATEAMSVLLQ